MDTIKIFQALTKYLPHFSEAHFVAKATPLERAQWLYALVYQTRFEFVSHFLFGPYSNYMKRPEEFLEGIFLGQGGVCLERVMALKFLIELFDIGECRYAIGGSAPGVHHPIDIEAVRQNLSDPAKKAISPYAHHAALVVKIGKEEWLLDPNGGRLGKIFLNPSLTRQILATEVSEKLGVLASFGQMFYHSVPEELFHLLVAYRRGSPLQMLHLICKVGLLVGPNFDVFMVPQPEVEDRLAALYPHRVQTMCWQIEGSLLAALAQHGLTFSRLPGTDPFIEKIDLAYNLLNEQSLLANEASLQMVLRIATAPWEQFTNVSSPISTGLMMRGYTAPA